MPPFRLLAALAVFIVFVTPALADPVTIRIGFAEIGVGNVRYAQSGGGAVAHAEGYLEKEFASAPDVKVEWNFFRGAGPAVNEAIANGQLDFAFQGDLPAIVARANGLKTRLIAANNIRGNLYLAVHPGSGITKIEDLKGRKVAQFRGTNLQLATDKLLAAHGLTERDVRFITMDFATATAALVAGDVDAAFGQADYLDLDRRGVAKVIYSTKGDDPTYTRHGHLLVTEAFEAARPDLVARVVKAVVKADAWTGDPANREAAFAIWAKSGAPVETFRADYDGQELKYRTSPLIDPFLVAAYADQAARAKEHGLLRRPVSTEGWFEPRYVDAAVRELGLEGFWPRYDASGRQASLTVR